MSETCPISYLPVEILRHIFTLLPDVEARRVLPDVCKIWRLIAHSIAQFWTRITLSGQFEGVKVEDDPYIWGKVAERAGDLPLDIVWDVITTKSKFAVLRFVSPPKYTTALQYFIERAPVSRWRSLKLLSIGDHKDVFLPALQTSNFSGLHALVTWPSNPKLQPVLDCITRTAKNLKIFECQEGFRRKESAQDLSDILSRISTLKCPELPFSTTQPIPDNIIRIELYTLPHGPRDFLHVTYLDVQRFNLYQMAHLQFSHLKTLRISVLHYESGTDTFPSPAVYGHFSKLQTLIYNSDDFSYIDAIKAPNLREIRFTESLAAFKSSSRDPFYRLTKSNNYTLLPPRVVFDVPLTIEMIHSVQILYRSAEHLTFSFKRVMPWGTWGLVKNLVIGQVGKGEEGERLKDGGLWERVKRSIAASRQKGSENDSSNLKSESTYAWPYLESLTLQFDWVEHDQPKWIRNIMEKRREGGLKLVTCVWSDGTTLCSE